MLRALLLGACALSTLSPAPSALYKSAVSGQLHALCCSENLKFTSRHHSYPPQSTTSPISDSVSFARLDRAWRLTLFASLTCRIESKTAQAREALAQKHPGRLNSNHLRKSLKNGSQPE